ncbi:ATP-binding protein [Dyadobacter subterraneus]|uniref:histidine kinase n=1 Tax=Dyadobacter subterraneus TaxID=2773304 RepID=A0ABR9W8I7_9BACT|nr:sensor histidine kinase [Dyadobacter subterraneus]MBE9461786.1 hypothetical protein [Dyadobacter subterraneus]
MKYFFYILTFLIISAGHLVAQSNLQEMPAPLIKLYSPKDYKAHGQNFAIVQNKQGVLYFGNFSGVLEYDGVFWKTIPTKNITKVSALYLDGTQRVMVGANDEFGYLAPDKSGSYNFVSINGSEKEFGAIINIFQTADGIYFVAKNKIFLWNGKKLKSWKTKESITSAFLANNIIYVFKAGIGLTRFDHGNFFRFPLANEAENIQDANSVLFLNGKTFVTTSHQGIFTFINGKLGSLQSPANDYLSGKEIFSGKVMNDNTLGIFASGGNFLSIHPENGEINSRVRENDRFVGERVNYWIQDRMGGLWMALNNGIAQMAITSPISEYAENENLRGQINDVFRFDGKLFTATSSGLYYLDNGKFLSFPSIKVAVWSLTGANGILYAATSRGVYSISKNNKATPLSDDFTFCIYQSKKIKSKLYFGLENGLAELDFSKGGRIRNIPGITGQIFKMAEDQDGNLWLESQTNGIFKFDQDSQKVTDYSSGKGLPTRLLNRISTGPAGLLVSNVKGVFQYDKSIDRFVPFTAFNKDKSAVWKGLISQDARGDIWTTNGDEKFITLYQKQSNRRYKELTVPFLPLADRTFNVIYPDANNIVWFGGADGMVRFDRNQNISYTLPYAAFIRKITAKGDTVLFNGFKEATKPGEKSTKLNYKFNDISFEFSGASLIPDDNLLFQYYLENFDKTWSPWTSKYLKEYTNLPPGNYKFHVKAQNVYNNQSNEASFDFTILPPLYQRWWAMLIYLAALVGGSLIIRQKRIEFVANKTRNLESMINERTEEVVQQKEELEKQSEELTATNDQLERIDEFVKSINSEVNTGKLFQMVLDRLCLFQNVDSASGLIYNKLTKNYQFIALAGKVDITSVENVSLTYAQAAHRYIDSATEVFEDIFVKNDFLYENLDNSIDSLFAPKSLITIVIRVESEVKSFITMENMEHSHAFGPRDFNMVRNLKEHLIGAYIKTSILENLENTLSNLKSTQQELIRQEKLASVGQLTKGIVDRILNPLNYINNFSQSSKSLLEEIEEVTEKYQAGFTEDDQDDLGSGVVMLKKNLEKIYEHGASTTRIVKDMQKLLKGKSTEFLVTELNPFLETKAKTALAEVLADYKGCDLHLDFDLYKVPVKVSLLPYEFSEVLQNLISNACYAVIEKSKIEKDYVPEVSIKTTKTRDGIRIQFRDNGKGIPQKEIEQIFSPFFTTKPTSKGTGLGLYMSKDIVEYHKGEMSINSKSGEYTIVEILLPVIN